MTSSPVGKGTVYRVYRTFCCGNELKGKMILVKSQELCVPVEILGP
jgi:hypothetical protein